MSLEREIGELAATVEALAPTLERMDEKLDAQGIEQARMKQEVSDARKAGEEGRKEIRSRLDQGAKSFEALRLQTSKLEHTVGTLSSGKSVSSNRWWDIVQLVLAGAIGAGLHRLVA